MSNYDSLRSKIQAEHASDTPSQIVAALNNKNIPAYRNIDTADIKRYLIVNDLWLPIKSSANPACIITMDALNIFPYFQVGVLQIRNKLISMMDALIAANLDVPFTTTNKAEILAMGDDLVSWADLNWSGDVQLWEIAEVLNG